jgi:hypothetical protein
MNLGRLGTVRFADAAKLEGRTRHGTMNRGLRQIILSAGRDPRLTVSDKTYIQMWLQVFRAPVSFRLL